jgi:hypothetical protein
MKGTGKWIVILKYVYGFINEEVCHIQNIMYLSTYYLGSILKMKRPEYEIKHIHLLSKFRIKVPLTPCSLYPSKSDA